MALSNGSMRRVYHRCGLSVERFDAGCHANVAVVAFAQKAVRTDKQTMGLFLSINGWSDNVVPAMKQNQDKSIILMEGYDLRTVLSQPLDLRRLLKAKLSALNLQSEPYFSVTQLLR
jgi:hypothetical protein